MGWGRVKDSKWSSWFWSWTAYSKLVFISCIRCSSLGREWAFLSTLVSTFFLLAHFQIRKATWGSLPIHHNRMVRWEQRNDPPADRVLQRVSCALVKQNIIEAPVWRHVNPIFPVMYTWLIGNFGDHRLWLGLHQSGSSNSGGTSLKWSSVYWWKWLQFVLSVSFMCSSVPLLFEMGRMHVADFLAFIPPTVFKTQDGTNRTMCIV